jgi:hypothetical protein
VYARKLLDGDATSVMTVESSSVISVGALDGVSDEVSVDAVDNDMRINGGGVRCDATDETSIDEEDGDTADTDGSAVACGSMLMFESIRMALVASPSRTLRVQPVSRCRCVMASN